MEEVSMPNCCRIRVSALLALFLVLDSLAAGAAPQPLPDAAAQSAAEKIMRELFKDQFARQEPAARIALAQKLLSLANETQTDAASQFVLFHSAWQVAASAGDFATAWEAIEESGKRFAINVFDVRLEMFSEMSKAPPGTPSENFATAASAAMEMMEQAARQERFDEAQHVAQVAEALGRRSGTPEQMAAVASRMRWVTDLRAQFRELKPALEQLKSQPNDPEANLIVGRYLCFSKGEWQAGVSHLAKASDKALQAAAQAESPSPADGAARKRAGDAWYEFAQGKGRTLQKSVLLAVHSRSAHWYWLALSDMAGLNKPLVEKRLTEIEAKLPTPVVLWHVIRQPVNTDGGVWVFPDGGGVVASVAPMADQSFTLRFETDPDGNWGGCRFRVSGPDAAKFDDARTEISLWAGHKSQITEQGRAPLFSKEIFPENKKWHSILVRVTPGRIIVLLDGAEFVDVAGENIAPSGFIFIHGNRGKVKGVGIRVGGGD
jgi:hypothetical protein